ncbi:nitrite reductase (NADH) small subunit [Dietzia kunjamensis subsp. schimae]|uniref:Nitrite reductase (NADH) small subunit n=1 Tax=Dietzia kunjamensis subsp. schimae TaxID=498198 RepID=A0ABY1N2G1_9ACTN|nr:nitrite reductase small subunit NirD [Dietzia kunjamensis]MBB1016692.1 nitrite reductase small subunit NirD [Dietzia kunjamensis subsp. schimae]SMO77209.1 nitrite reductase (NADH) small subunit [Dietzia kunjamensis subsp. schimae]
MTTTQLFTATRTAEIAVCSVDRLIPGRGVAALLPDGRQVAVYKIDDDEVRALCNIDPVARAAVMSRGLVGDRAGEPAVISPIGKQAYALADGRGLDDPSHGLSVFPARVAADGTVFVATQPAVRHARVIAA